MSDSAEIKINNNELSTITVNNDSNDLMNRSSTKTNSDEVTNVKDNGNMISNGATENETDMQEHVKEEETNIFNKAIEGETNGETKLPSIANDDIDVGDISSSSSSSSSSSDEEDDGDDNEKNVDEDEDLEEDGPVDSGPIRSKNEILEESVIEIPEDYKLKPDEKIQLIGTIKSIYENNIIIAATMSGEQRVLKDGSIFCLDNRDIIGTLNEVFGPLQNPFYRICFKKDKIGDMTPMIKEKIGENVFYAVPEAHWVDTFELKRNRGTDASNRFDEEISESEQEFSDDEKEAQYKKMKKDSKKKKNSKNSNNTSAPQNERPRTNNYKNNNNNNRNQNKSHKNNQKYGDYPSMRLPLGMTSSNRSTTSTTGYVSRNARGTTSNDQPSQSRHTSSIYDDDENVVTKIKSIQNSQNTNRNNFQGTIPQQNTYNNLPQQTNPYYGLQNQSYPGMMNYPQQHQPPNNMYFQMPPPPPQNPSAMNMGYPINPMQQVPPTINNSYNSTTPYYGYNQPPAQGNMNPTQQNMEQVKLLHQLLMQQQQNNPYEPPRNNQNQGDQKPY
ncbi:hypothetical protein C6P45_003112 [Maudiozyma exigua]|uniref:H/ACA ribonucleoprotein complex non-core subunit NAF1 n=1 Tax=Maudiozyma exigua TaxID=34358 RepID=A0A9P7BAJ7_MAUEX|nr:hypothetical protein C6P45_003112 [Kazachstania exigua]